uniref:Small ribosomal subunit protein eS24 n=1 Tax=Homalodisca liturata TaxID=320908 RepID=A0A1B6K6C4_9HEMI
MPLAITVTRFNTNALLGRKEVEMSISHPNQATPNKEVISSELSNIYTIPSSQIYIYGMKTGFGAHLSVARAHMYNSADDLRKIERPFVVARLTGVSETKVKRIIRKQERKKKAKIFGTVKRNMKKVQRRNKD